MHNKLFALIGMDRMVIILGLVFASNQSATRLTRRALGMNA